MKVWRGHPGEWKPAREKGGAVTIGVFDGVHRGHQAVLTEATRRAARRGLVDVVLTFDIHPLSVVAPASAPKMLTSLEGRLEIFRSLGVSRVGVLPFESIQQITPEGFVKEILVEVLAARLVTVGADFRYGAGRKGDADHLRQAGEKFGFAVEAVELLKEDDQPISSSTIRSLIAAGDVAGAMHLLGRQHELAGVVMAGSGRGKTIGFPTANLGVDASLAVPGRGVYAVRAVVAGRVLPAVCNIGVRPTFADQSGVGSEMVEVHILDWAGDLYGQQVGVRFVSRLRPEMAFAGAEELSTQILQDIQQARLLLAS